MPAPAVSDKAHFDIHASVVFQLGESLVSDEVQALVELVKNAYDADGTYAKVTIDTKASLGAGYAYTDAVGYIIVEDDGVGMTGAAIERGWLTISSSLKRDFKQQRKTTPLGRTPLGDKGLGRLGAQRLGYNVEIFTRPEGEDIEHHIAFSWRDFLGETVLSDVPVVVESTSPPQRKRGTKLVISDLKDPAAWTGDAEPRLAQELSKMISPFKEVRDFRVSATVDGKRLELPQITELMRGAAQLRYHIDFDGEVFRVRGKARLDYFRPNADTVEELDLFRTLVEADGGQRFFSFLAEQRKARQFDLGKPREKGWFVEYAFDRKLADFDSLALVDGQPASPGPFHGEIDFIALDPENVDRGSIFDRASEYRKFIREISGVRVYRDGFGIRVDRDWLQLGQQWTGARSYYGLRPGNTLGYVALTARDNAVLEETTDREGFKATPHYMNFYEMLKQFVKFSGDAQSFMRRGWNEYRRKNQHAVAAVESRATPEALSLMIRGSLARANDYRKSLEQATRMLVSTAQQGQQAIRTMETASPHTPAHLGEVREQMRAIERSIREARSITAEVEKYLAELANREAVSELLSSQIEGLREQLSLVYETVSLGLTAEALSHEIHNIADQLAQRTRQATTYLEARGMSDARLVSYIEYVHTSIAGLRKQLSHFDPSLRYVREKRETIDVMAFLKEVADYYEARLGARDIELQLKPIKADDFVLCMNRGKLLQVVDNIFLNSEYWLREDLRLGRIRRGIITVEIAKPFVRITDNGRGIHPSVEASLFEPFTTTKGRGKGRGLGLFVVRQLLDSEGCIISLLPIRNEHGRLCVFEVDFSRGLDKGG